MTSQVLKGSDPKRREIPRGTDKDLSGYICICEKGAVSKQNEIAPNYFKRKRVPKGPFIVRIIV